MRRGEATSQAAGMHPASPGSALLYQYHLRLLQSSYCQAAQLLGRVLEGAELYQLPASTQRSALLIWFHLARPEQSAALNWCKQLRMAAWAFLYNDTAHTVHTPQSSNLSSCSQRQPVLVFISTLIPTYWSPTKEPFLVTTLPCTKCIY